MVKDVKVIGDCVHFMVTASILQSNEISRIKQMAINHKMEQSHRRNVKNGTSFVYRNPNKKQREEFVRLLEIF